MRQGVGMNADVGDSTVRNEVRENRTLYYSREVPITGLAREDIENSILRKTWKIGRVAEGGHAHPRARRRHRASWSTSATGS